MATRGINRRSFLLGVGASGILSACGGGGSGSSASSAGSGTGSGTGLGAGAPTASASARIPLTIDAAHTDLPAGTAVYAYVIGAIQTPSGVTQYRIDSAGMPHVISAADNTNAAGTFPGSSSLSGNDAATIATNYPLAWADYSIPVTVGSSTVIDLANLNPTSLPGLGTGTAAFSGRIYLSVGVPKLPFSALNSSAYTAPVPNAYPGKLTLFDWIEFSYDSAGNFNGNTTQVDQFGFALLLDGTPGGAQQGQFSQSRPAMLSSVANLPAGFNVPVTVQASSAYPPALTVNGSATLRVLSPKSITAENGYAGPLSTYFDQTIENWYNTWTSTPLVTNDLATGTYTGLVQSGKGLTFYSGSTPGGTPAFTVGGAGKPGISSYDVWQCANALATGSDAAKNVQKMLAAAFNRGVMANSLNDATCRNDAASFYRIANGNTLVFNAWAQLFHQLSSNSLSYAFPYDDVCDQNPSIGLTGTQSVTITLGKFFS
ncbi:MAG TPA: beta-1,3-glucanase family protein [Paraburkholderia sp.]|nr:beta-1,3-glucanase family protein [Paraburkholderia sp.]